jgi:hypothetical protein
MRHPEPAGARRTGPLVPLMPGRATGRRFCTNEDHGNCAGSLKQARGRDPQPTAEMMRCASPARRGQQDRGRRAQPSTTVRTAIGSDARFL